MKKKTPNNSNTNKLTKALLWGEKSCVPHPKEQYYEDTAGEELCYMNRLITIIMIVIIRFDVQASHKQTNKQTKKTRAFEKCEDTY